MPIHDSSAIVSSFAPVCIPLHSDTLAAPKPQCARRQPVLPHGHDSIPGKNAVNLELAFAGEEASRRKGAGVEAGIRVGHAVYGGRGGGSDGRFKGGRTVGNLNI